MTPHQRIVERINWHGDINRPATPRPVLSLEEFFEGNDDPGSIGYNLNPPVGPQHFYQLLKGIRDRPDVADVLVEVTQHEAPAEWPSSDTIWVITSAAPDEVQEWMGDCYGDDVYDGWVSDRTREPYQIPPSMRAVGIWWD